MSMNMLEPVYYARAVTPNDSTDLPGGICRGLYIGTSGNLSVVMEGESSTITFANVPVGVFAIRVVRVRSTSTTASNLIALY